MIKEIKYGGYSAQPSDYECQDGDLAMSLNLINEDGALKGIAKPATISDKIPSGYKVVYIHNLPNTTDFNYIIEDDEGRFGFRTSTSVLDSTISGMSRFFTPGDSVEVLRWQSIGNTLVIFADDGVHYCVWGVSDDGLTGYVYLGKSMPELSLRFWLNGSVENCAPGKIELGKEFNIFATLNDTFSNAVMGAINSAVANSHKDGFFVFPFLIRYAYRLYDGTHIRQSAPIMLVPVFGDYPTMVIKLDEGQSRINTDYVRTFGFMTRNRLKFRIENAESILSDLDKWKNIIAGVDFYVSLPIYTYDQSGEANLITMSSDYRESYQFGGTMGSGNRPEDDDDQIMLRKVSDLYSYFQDFDGVVRLPRIDENDFRKRVEAVTNFYLIKSYTFEELKTANDNGGVVEMGEDVLPSLAARETLEDDYDSHNQKIARAGTEYNSRLNLTNVTNIICADYNPSSALLWADSFDNSGLSVKENTIEELNIYTCYQTERGRFVTLHNLPGMNAIQLPWFYHPSSQVYKVVLVWKCGNGSYLYRNIEMKPHEYLNGSYCYIGMGAENIFAPSVLNNAETFIKRLGTFVEEVTVDAVNKVYTSEINNPYIFPVTGINTLGTGRIIGVSTAAKAMSQGQFGQYPLYAFTSEGVWALSVATDGTFSSKQPITRDVCIGNGEGITQLDNAVLFPTDRGIMMISGSQTKCISDVINSEYPFDARELPGFDKLHGMLGEEHASDSCFPTLSFLDFLKDCRMIYDYVHQRVIVYAPDITYAYVFSLKSGLWGMMNSKITSNLNSYPDALAVDSENRLVDFSLDSDELYPGLIVTRPLKLDMPNIHKTIDTVIQRGFFRKGNVASVLYGSRDLINWHLVWSSKDHYLRGFRGTPYKYFRIALVCDLKGSESIYGASIGFTPKLTNNLR